MPKRYPLAVVLLVLTASAARVATAQPSTAVTRKAPPATRPARGATAATAAPTPADYAKLADDVEMYWKRIILAPWFPRSVDTRRGGFNAAYDATWKPLPRHDGGRFVVFQSRMTYAASRAAMRDDLREKYLPYAEHGLTYLHDHLWDPQHGGFFWRVKADRSVDVELKALYGQAFGLYAAAAAARATDDPRATDLARRAFAWLEKHAHDKANGGYLEILNRAGRPATPADRPERALGKVGQKSTNGQLHAIEALTELYLAWPDPLVKERIAELIDRLCNKAYQEPGSGYLIEVLTDDWRAVSNTASYGHDIEGAHLIHGAAAAIGTADDARVRRVVRGLIDNVIAVGIDPRDGGVFGGGTPTAVTDRSKTWWAQYESANGLLLAHELWGHETPRYWDAFLKQWRMINTKITGRSPPGVRGGVTPDGKPVEGNKGHDWKAAYHETRCLDEIEARLRRLAERN